MFHFKRKSNSSFAAKGWGQGHLPFSIFLPGHDTPQPHCNLGAQQAEEPKLWQAGALATHPSLRWSRWYNLEGRDQDGEPETPRGRSLGQGHKAINGGARVQNPVCMASGYPAELPTWPHYLSPDGNRRKVIMALREGSSCPLLMSSYHHQGRAPVIYDGRRTRQCPEEGEGG